MAMFNFPEYRTTNYTLNHETGRYEKQPELTPFAKLPFELKVETTQDARIKANGANHIITGRVRGGKRLFFTGLLPLFNSSVVFHGNDYQHTPQGKKNSLIIFRFSPDFKKLRVFYFNHYYIHNIVERLKFIGWFIQHKGEQ
jgi:hypothetical protein